MKKYILLIVLFSLSWGCKDEEFLSKKPKDLLFDEAVWRDKALVLSVVADLYNRLPEYQSVKNTDAFADFHEAIISENGANDRQRNNDWGYGEWGRWDYGLIREVNLFIEKCEAATALAPADRARFLAEGRLIRAWIYFEHVKSMGGVPLILEPLTYELGSDPATLRRPRASEADMYDFIIKELQEIQPDLPNSVNEKSRATQGLALAMQSRAALYAGSIAKYGSARTPSVVLSNGEVGIPASRAEGYYQTALQAAKDLIALGTYSLYMKESQTLEERFAKIFYDKTGNSEVIFVEDFKLKSGKTSNFTILNQPLYNTEEPGDAGRLNPTLNLVQSFEKLDNTFAPLTRTNANGLLVDENNQIRYFDHPLDLFAGRDARLGGTVMLPGSFFKGNDLDIWAGWIIPSTNTVFTENEPGKVGKDPLPNKPQKEQVVGNSGPIQGFAKSAQTGFYLRKHLDPAPGSGQRGSGGEAWWVRYRYAEVLLNAAEAAFELGDAGTAADYMNEVRRRAGFQQDLTAGEITFDRIVHERRVEFAFEGHDLWDNKRWRIADQVWNGSRNDLTSRPDVATEPQTQPYALWPYKVYDPANPNNPNPKWVFKKLRLEQATGADRFRLGNYYSYISDDNINRNPLLVRNPNQ